MPTVQKGSANKASDGQPEAGLLQLLADPKAYPDRTRSVKLIETHISWVFLTDRFVYKLKKPVKFDFLDFSTLERRHWACEQEVRLNRRLARDVYVGVVPITREKQGRLRLGGSGEAVEWAVKMHRLSAERRLEHLLQSQEVSEAELTALAATLTQFYQHLPPLDIRVQEYCRRIQEHVMGNRNALLEGQHELSDVQVRRIHAAQLSLLRIAPDLLATRVCDGRVIEGHGDLRPDHIYFTTTGPVVIDCIEFNEEFRQLDVLDELGFLAMECERLNAPDAGREVLQEYQRRCCDQWPVALLSFYKCYRACVRAKVHLLHAQQLAEPQRQEDLDIAGRYLDLAEQYADQLAPPLLLLVRGLPGSGKSTLARALSESLEAELLQTDVLRRQLFGESAGPAEINQGRYTPENRSRVYDQMLEQAGDLLGTHLLVVLDGTFPTADLRWRAIELAERSGAKALVVDCQCPQDVALQRINQRLQRGGSESEVRPEHYEKMKSVEQPDPPGVPHCVVETTDSVPELLQQVFAHLRSMLFA